MPVTSEDSSTEQERRESNGGLTALSGFYFQFLGTLADVVNDYTVYEAASDVPNEPVETLFGVEIGDEDYWKSHGREIQLVQFKFSAEPAKHLIYSDELYDIVKNLVLMKRRIIKSKSDANVRCILRTNRSLGSGLQSIWDAVRAKPSRKHNELGKHRGFQTYLLECEWQHSSEQEWFDTVEAWGRNFAMTSNEINAGIERVASQFQQRVLSGQKRFGKDAVEKAFVGFDQPRTLPQARNVSSKQIESFLKRLSVPDITSAENFTAPRPRKIQELQLAIDNHALVVLEGDGGNGKSTLLAAALRTHSASRFLLGSKIDKVQSTWIPYSIATWRNDDGYTDGINDIERAITRLTNDSSTRPILIAALDALDEIDMDKSAVEGIIGFFETLEKRSPPLATLVVTCRSRDDLKRLSGEPGHDHLQSFQELEVGQYISIRPFDDPDIADAVRRANKLDRSVRDRLRQEFRGGGSTSVETVGSSRNSTFPPVDNQFKEALRHPIIWGLLFDGDFEPSEQHAIMSGEKLTRERLAENVLYWFGSKCQARTEDRVSSDKAIRILRYAAENCCDKSPPYRFIEDWEKPLYQRSNLSDYALAVMRQAISAGLVRGTPNAAFDFDWEWRHPFLAECLARRFQKTL